MTEKIDAVEANRLQTLWMQFDSANSTKAEQEAMCVLYARVPTSYISQNDSGQCSVFFKSQPISWEKLSIVQAFVLAEKHNIQTALRWNSAGYWFDASTLKLKV